MEVDYCFYSVGRVKAYPNILVGGFSSIFYYEAKPLNSEAYYFGNSFSSFLAAVLWKIG